MTTMTAKALPAHPPLPELRGLQIRPPRPEEAAAISDLLRAGAPDTIPQDEAQVRRRLATFELAWHPEYGVLACAALHPIDGGRLELRSVAVAAGYRRHRLGSRLVRRAMARARSAGKQLVCVTGKPRFFRGLGFRPIPLAWVPEKAERRGEETLRGGRRRVALAYHAIL